MGTGLTELDICNQTLDLLSQSRVMTQQEYTDESSSEARWFKRNFAPTIRAALRGNIWSFAKEQAVLTADATAPDHGYAQRYAIPATWLRVLPLTYNGAVGGQLIPFSKVGNFLHTDWNGDLNVTGIVDTQDPDDWDDIFVDYGAAKLAQKYALKLTGKTNYKGIADQAVAEAMDGAMVIDAIEDYPDPIEQHDIIRVRSF